MEHRPERVLCRQPDRAMTDLDRLRERVEERREVSGVAQVLASGDCPAYIVEGYRIELLALDWVLSEIDAIAKGGGE